MKKTEELVAGLRQCISGGCEGCPFDNGSATDEEWCVFALVRDAADRLEEYVDRCARFSEEIMVLREQQRWIPVGERLPERTMPPHDVLVYHRVKCGMYVDRAWYSHERNKWSSVLGMNLNVTHWMPLPPAPEEVNNGKDG